MPYAPQVPSGGPVPPPDGNAQLQQYAAPAPSVPMSEGGGSNLTQANLSLLAAHHPPPSHPALPPAPPPLARQRTPIDSLTDALDALQIAARPFRQNCFIRAGAPRIVGQRAVVQQGEQQAHKGGLLAIKVCSPHRRAALLCIDRLPCPQPPSTGALLCSLHWRAAPLCGPGVVMRPSAGCYFATTRRAFFL